MAGRTAGETKHSLPRFSADGHAVLSLPDLHVLSWTSVATARPTGPGNVSLRLDSGLVLDRSSDGLFFAVGGYYGPELFAVDKDGPKPLMLMHGNQVSACRFSPDSHWLVSSSWDRTVRLWSVPDGRLLCPPLPHEQMVQDVVFSPDGRLLATWQTGGVLRVWRIPRTERAATVPSTAATISNLRAVPTTPERSSAGSSILTSLVVQARYR